MSLGTSHLRKTIQRLSKAGRAKSRLLLAIFAAALLAMTPACFGQALTPGGPQDFGTVAVGLNPAAQITLSFSASVPTTINSVIATTDGVQKKDFTIVSQTCTGAQTPPESCSVTIGFSPLAPGLRKGALSIMDATGTVVNRVFLHGIGQGGQIAVSPSPGTVLASVSPLSPPAYAPSGSATDGAGDIYFNDLDFPRILEKDSSGALSVTGSVLSTVDSGMAIDGAGTLYIAAGTLVYSLVPGGALTQIATPGVTLTNATGVVVDGSGFLYIADSGQSHIVRVGTDGTTSVLTMTGLSTPLSQPHGLAVDNTNLYIADTGNNRVVAAVLFGGAATVLPTGMLTLSGPKGVAIDAAGTVSIADTGNKRVVMAPISGAGFVLQTPGVTFGSPVSIRGYDDGDLLVVDTQVGLVTLTRSASALTFPTATGVGHLDTTDGALPFTVMNSGNVALQLTVPATGTNPLISGAAFATTAASTCPLLTHASPANATTQLTVGEVCDYTVSFTPQVVGSNTETATLTAVPVGGGATLAPVVTLTGTGIANITKFKVVLNPTVTQPGAPVMMTVSALDINGVVDPTYRGTATFASTDASIVFGGGMTYTFTAADAGVHVFTGAAAVKFNTPGTFTVTATDGTVTGVSANELVEWANAFSLVATPTTVQLGTQVTLTVTATFNGVVAPKYTGTVVLSSTDPAASFLAGTSYVFKVADNGTHTFMIPNGVQFNTVGLQTISGMDGVISGISNQVDVVLADSFAIMANPSTLFVGQNAGYTITALFRGVVATNFTGPITLSTTDADAAFVGTGTDALTYTFTAADKGVHTLTPTAGVQFNTAGRQTIGLKSGSLTGTSNPIQVIAADSFTIVATPSPILMGQSVGFTVTAAHQGTTVTNYTGTVIFTTTDSSAKFVSSGNNTFTYTFTAADNGTHTFTAPAVQFNAIGTFTVHATAGAVTGVSNNIVVVPADAFMITAAPTTLFGGQSAGYTVTAMYQGMPVAGFTGPVTFTTTDTSAKFAATGTNTFTYTFTAADHGAHVFNVASGVQFNSSGTFTIDAADGAATGVSNSITVTGLDALVIAASPVTVSVGQSAGFTVTASYHGALAANFTGTVTFTTTDSSAKFALTGANTFTYTFTGADGGKHTFPLASGVQFNTAGTYTIHAADGPVTAVSNNVVVEAVDGFTMTAAPAALLLGQSAGYTVTATYHGALATTFTGTVTFTSTDPKAVFLNGADTYTFTAADNGTHTFPAASGVQFNSLGTFTIHGSSGTLTAVSNNIAVTNPTVVMLTSSLNPVLLGAPTTLTATIALATGGTIGPAGGTVTFADNGLPIGTAPVVNGVAALPNVIFTQFGLHPLTAVYSGDPAFNNGSTSAILTEGVEDFSLAITPGTPSAGSALVGHAVTYSLLLTPVGGTTFAAPVTFTLSDELTGAKAVFTPATVATGAGQTTLSLAITPTQLLGMLHETSQPQRTSRQKVAPIALAVLALLPLVGLRRRKGFRKLLLLAVSLLPLTLMTGCLSSATDGYYGKAPGAYQLTVTGTSGTLTHTVEIQITVQ